MAGVHHMTPRNSELVFLRNGSVTANAVDPDPANANWLISSGGTSADDVGAYTWLLSGAAADYDVRATEQVGVVSGGSSATNTWLNTGTSRSWGKVQSGPGTDEVTLLIELRPTGGGTTLASATITLSANVS